LFLAPDDLGTGLLGDESERRHRLLRDRFETAVRRHHSGDPRTRVRAIAQELGISVAQLGEFLGAQYASSHPELRGACAALITPSRPTARPTTETRRTRIRVDPFDAQLQ